MKNLQRSGPPVLAAAASRCPWYLMVVFRLSSTAALFSLIAFWAARIMFSTIDMIAALSFRECADSCSIADPLRTTCDVMLLAVAWFNALAVVGFALIMCIRWYAEERSYDEARCVTYGLVAINILLKAGDIGLPIALTTHCFAGSLFPPYSNAMHPNHCAAQWCAFGTLYWLYGIYSLIKCMVSGVDLLLNSGTLFRKPGQWYRMRRIG